MSKSAIATCPAPTFQIHLLAEYSSLPARSPTQHPFPACPNRASLGPQGHSEYWTKAPLLDCLWFLSRELTRVRYSHFVALFRHCCCDYYNCGYYNLCLSPLDCCWWSWMSWSCSSRCWVDAHCVGPVLWPGQTKTSWLKWLKDSKHFSKESLLFCWD